MTISCPSVRQKKVSELLRRHVSIFFSKNFQDKILTCNMVNVSPDLKNAKVYISKLNYNIDFAANLDLSIENYKPIKIDKVVINKLKKSISEEQDLKNVPDLTFFIIKSLDF